MNDKEKTQKDRSSGKEKPVVFAFIDSQNLNLGVRSEGWKLDYRKFRQYLRQKYSVQQAWVFIGYVAGNEALYTNLQKWGYIVIFKPTLEKPDGIVKGNVDAELVLHAMIEYPNYERAVIVSGDGDFHCLIEYLDKQKKLLKVIAPNRQFSGLLRRYFPYIVRVDRLRASLELKINKKARTSGRPKS
ncbi:MAG TPA: NYN domain-containing protein [Candidatus Saccharimonadales bacterium]|nr:NYN domain-containing protein [Candidatus Saccharimonadales bacterium]